MGFGLESVSRKVDFSCRAILELKWKNWLVNLHAILIVPGEVRVTQRANVIGDLVLD